MNEHDAKLWGVCPSQNHYFLHGFGDGVRNKAKKKGIFNDFSTDLGLVYGAFFGFKVLHRADHYTRFGQIKDDVERCLRYWHLDGKVLRFMRYCVQKTHKPGQFFVNKGGISAGSSADRHQAECTKALNGIIDDFAWRYARFPVADECSQVSCGLVWRQPTRVESTDSAQRKHACWNTREKRKSSRMEAAQTRATGEKLPMTMGQRAASKRHASVDETRVAKRKKGVQPGPHGLALA